MMYIHFDIASVWDYCFVSSKVYTYIKIVLEQMGQIQVLKKIANDYIKEVITVLHSLANGQLKALNGSRYEQYSTHKNT